MSEHSNNHEAVSSENHSQPYIFSSKSVNVYVIRVLDGFVMIDSGFADKREELVRKLSAIGCTPENLKIVFLTHGDSDHVGNCAFLQQEYKVKIALHKADLKMVETGDMSWNRKPKPDRHRLFFRFISLFDRFSSFEKFTPDIFLKSGDDLAKFGFKAKVIQLPGHSKGSVGFLTEENDLYCGDLFINISKPQYHFMIDDMSAATESLEKIKKLNIRTVYPGHGKPFSMERLLRRLE